MNESAKRLDHTKKHLTIRGCSVTAAFAPQRNPDLLPYLRRILMASAPGKSVGTLDGKDGA